HFRHAASSRPQGSVRCCYLRHPCGDILRSCLSHRSLFHARLLRHPPCTPVYFRLSSPVAVMPCIFEFVLQHVRVHFHIPPRSTVKTRSRDRRPCRQHPRLSIPKRGLSTRVAGDCRVLEY